MRKEHLIILNYAKRVLSFVVVFIYLSSSALGQSTAITIDGEFEDWNSNLTQVNESPKTTTGVDLISLSVTNNRDYLFLKIEADSEFDFSDDIINHDIKIYLDTDGDTTNGDSRYKGIGAELVINLNNRRLTFYNPNAVNVNLNDIGIRVAPTVTSKTFEFAIQRDILPDNQNQLFTNSAIRILTVNESNNDKLPNNRALKYIFDESQTEGYDIIDLDKNDTSLIRIVAYNTLFNGLTVDDRIPHYERIMKALNPDIIGFSECWDVPANAVKTLMDDWLPVNNPGGWFVEKLDSRGLITASRWEISERWDDLPNQFPVLIDLPDEYTTDVLFTNAHLNCCSNESGRQNQADAYTAFILDAKTSGGSIDLPENTPFIYGGDLNLVGFSQQLSTLMTGDIQNTSTYGQGGMPDWDNTEVTDLINLHTEQPFSFTWKDEGSSFPPGKLDFMLYSDAVLDVDKSFVLRTEEMDILRLTEYNLRNDDTESASDHFPVIADFVFERETTNKQKTNLGTLELSPNPVKDEFRLTFHNPGSYSISITDNSGKQYLQEVTSEKVSIISTSQFPSGLYFVTVSSSNGEMSTLRFTKY